MYCGQQQREATGLWGEGNVLDSGRRRPDVYVCVCPLQLDISGKLYLAPLTTVGGGWKWAARWFPGALPVQSLRFTDL